MTFDNQFETHLPLLFRLEIRRGRCRLHGGLSTGPRTAEGRARIAAAQLKHGRYVNWRSRREKEKGYYQTIRLVMAQAREAGLIED